MPNIPDNKDALTGVLLLYPNLPTVPAFNCTDANQLCKSISLLNSSCFAFIASTSSHNSTASRCTCA